MFNKIDELQKKLDKYRSLLHPAILKNVEEDLILRWTYHSNAIAGNTLTLLENKVVLEGISVGGKRIRELFEVINHKNAIYYIEDIVRKDEIFSEWQIKKIHQLIFKNIDDTNGGNYRQKNPLIPNAIATSLDYTLINEKIYKLIEWYNFEAYQLHPIERAAKIHIDFSRIQPFIDGNGRVSRLLMNLELLKAGYPPCIITVENRLAYYDALSESIGSGKTEGFIKLVIESTLNGFKPYEIVLNL